VANATTGTSTGLIPEEPTPAVARRTWPRWLALGLTAIVVAVVAVVWGPGDRLLLGAVGLFLAVRGALLVRTAADAGPELSGRARGLGAGALAGGLVALVVALTSAAASGWVLLAGVPLLLIGAGLAQRGRGPVLWGLVAAAALAGVGLAGTWDRAMLVAAALAALAVAILGVVTLVGAASLRAIGARPDPEPSRAVGCAGCACGAGGCGS
jgi:hypothetical protein